MDEVNVNIDECINRIDCSDTSIDTDSLVHHGILGMHWGKKNGPPYPLDEESHTGEQRTKSAIAKLIDKQKAKKQAKAEAKAAHEAEMAKLYSYKTMSDEEIRKYINRAKIEKEYKDYVLPKQKDPAIKRMAKDAGEQLSKKIVSDVVTPWVVKQAKKIVNLEEKEKEVNSIKLLSKDLNKLSDKEMEALSKRAGHEAVVKKTYFDSKNNKDKENEKNSYDFIKDVVNNSSKENLLQNKINTLSDKDITDLVKRADNEKNIYKYYLDKE